MGEGNIGFEGRTDVTRKETRYVYIVRPRNCFLVRRKQAYAAKIEAAKEGIVVPVTLEDYCIKTNASPAEQQLDMADFYDDLYELDDDEYELDDDEYEDDQLCASEYEYGDDSGNGDL